MSDELKVLYVEDSKALGTTIKREIEKELKIKVVLVPSYQEAADLLKNKDHDFFAALLDLNLPDAPDGQIIDLVTSQKISSIIFTGTFNEEIREKIWSKPHIADYILKEGVYSIPYVISLIRRLNLNKSVKVLVVDDSSTMRKYICNLLHMRYYQMLCMAIYAAYCKIPSTNFSPDNTNEINFEL
jgi:PleD family two-component response regulator